MRRLFCTTLAVGLCGCWSFQELDDLQAGNSATNNGDTTSSDGSSNSATNNGSSNNAATNNTSNNGTTTTNNGTVPYGCTGEAISLYEAQTPFRYFPAGAEFGDEVSLTLMSTSPPVAKLGWTERISGDMEPRLANVRLFDADDTTPLLTIEEPNGELLSAWASGWNSYGMATGPDDSGRDLVWATSIDACSTTVDAVMWLWKPGDAIPRADSGGSCPDTSVRWSFDFVGGHDPFIGASRFPPTVAYLTEGQPELNSLTIPFTIDRRFGVDWSAPRPDAPEAWMRGTRGRLVLLSDEMGQLYVWDAQVDDNGDIPQTPKAPVLVTFMGNPIMSARPMASLVALDPGSGEYALAVGGTTDVQFYVLNYNHVQGSLTSRLSTSPEYGQDTVLRSVDLAPIKDGLLMHTLYDTADGTVGANFKVIMRDPVDGDLDWANCEAFDGYRDIAGMREVVDVDVDTVRIGNDIYAAAAIHFTVDGEHRVVVDGAYLRDYVPAR